jgi:ADP-ribosylglycohydrolase
MMKKKFNVNRTTRYNIMLLVLLAVLMIFFTTQNDRFFTLLNLMGIVRQTVPQAIIAFLESESPEDALRIGVSLGGDSDTLCAICGAIAEGYYGITEGEERSIRSYLDRELNGVLDEFRAVYHTKTDPGAS